MSDWIEHNAFYVLGLEPDCGPMDVEREGQKLLAMLELGVGKSATYGTPLGPRKRDAELVRTAMAELREPRRRLIHELWACPAPDSVPDVEPGSDADTETTTADDPRGPWREAFVALGWRR